MEANSDLSAVIILLILPNCESSALIIGFVSFLLWIQYRNISRISASVKLEEVPELTLARIRAL